MPTKKAAPKKAAAKKTVAKKTVAKKAVSKKAAPKKAAPKKAAVKKAAVKKAAPPPPITPPVVAEPERPEPPPGTVIVSFEGPAPQRRATVAFRVFLAIPHLIYVYVLGIVAYVLVIIGWFGALFTGRLPKGMDTFITRIIQQYARVFAYSWLLLTDRYPSFALDEPDYVVSVEVTPTRLNRLAVLVRLFLLIPALIVQTVLTFGLAVMAVVTWLIVLIVGRLPAPLFEAEAAALRYQVRLYAFAAMLTGEYPRGLFGDKPGGESTALPSALPARPRIIRLVLSKAAKRLVILFIVLGALLQAASITVSAVNASRTTAASRDLRHAHDQLGTTVRQFTVDAQACAVSGGIDCIHSANRRLGEAFTRFGQRLEDVSFPLVAIDAANRLHADTADIVAVNERLIGIRSGPEYQATAGQLAGLLQQFDRDYQRLAELL